MRIWSRISLGLIALLSGCVQQPGGAPPQTSMQSASMNTTFRDEDFAWTKAPGTAVFRGEAFLKTVGGEVKTCAGNPVYLIADNAYSREAAALVAAKMKPVRDPRYLSYRRQTMCDSQGRFEFKDLPAGPWSVIAEVVWQTPVGTVLAQQGGVLRRRLELRDGEEKRLIMSSGDMHLQF